MRTVPSYKKLEAYLDIVQASGGYYFTAQEIKEKLSLSNASFHTQISPLLLKRSVAIIRREFYVIVTQIGRAHV